MNSLLLPVLTALLIGLLVGVLTMWEGKVEQVTGNGDNGPSPVNSALAEDDPRLKQFEQQVQQLKSRLVELEQQLHQRQQTDTDTGTDLADAGDIADQAEASDPLTRENLVNAGISSELASDLMRRMGEQEYQRLALRDRAIREGYFRSGRYFRELRELRQQQLSLRDEIGDPAYDRYLYQTGQNNRVAVTSVMAGSPAEQTGMRQGDILLRYNNQDVFSWNEIRQATTQGQPGEYVTLDVLRDGQPLSLMLPRGPLGVKLDAARIDPQQLLP
jgi:membrane-associated protease RseP (regulator of RpoE activity)